MAKRSYSVQLVLARMGADGDFFFAFALLFAPLDFAPFGAWVSSFTIFRKPAVEGSLVFPRYAASMAVKTSAALKRFRQATGSRRRIPRPAHLQTRELFRSIRGSRRPPRRLSAYARRAGCCARFPHLRAGFPVSALRHSATEATPGPSRRKTRAARRSARRRNGSPSHLDLLVCGSAIAMHHNEFFGQPQQAFRVSHEEISAGVNATPEFFHQAFLLRLVKVHHDVAAENDVVALGQEFRLQIVKVKVDQFAQRFFDGIPLADFVEVAQAVAVIHRAHLVLGIHSLLPGA